MWASDNWARVLFFPLQWRIRRNMAITKWDVIQRISDEDVALKNLPIQNVLFVAESFRCRGFTDRGRKRARSLHLVRATDKTVGRCRVVNMCHRNVLLLFSWCVSRRQYQVAVYWSVRRLARRRCVAKYYLVVVVVSWTSVVHTRVSETPGDDAVEYVQWVTDGKELLCSVFSTRTKL